ncbi:putative inorganic phosphate cotransporter [Epargyreus clarus]|uniref:putative inorganic phosphate cotransporter n=1 Tax=Epargyreus clarus TaxID=520877 RepID=UPI003C2B7598
MRAQLSVTLVSMTGDDMPRHHSIQCHTLKNYSTSESVRLFNEDFSSNNLNHTKLECQEVAANLSKWNVYRTYEWKKSTQEMILFSFFVGYTSMMMPMGLLAQRLGGKVPVMIALAANGVLSIVSPWLPIWWGWQAFCVCRLLQGMTQAAFYPSIHTMLARWSPLCERGRLSSYIYTGSQFGTILAFQLAGLFAGSPVFRWPATFWSLGIASLVCFCLLSWLGAASPHEHPSISAEEFAFITKDGSVDLVPKKRKTPWKHILTSHAVWGLVTAQIGSNIGYLLVLTQIPLYMNKVLGLDIKRNGLYSSLPYIAMYLTALLFGFLSDLAANKNLMSVVNIRRTANTIGLVVSGLIFLAFSYITDTTLAVITLIASLGTHSGVHVGFHINQIDLAPNFAGPIMAMGNMLGNMSGLSVPFLVTSIVRNDVGNQSRWQIVFLVIAVIQIITNTVFVIFAKGTVRDWNFYGEEEKDGQKEEVCVIKGDTVVIMKSEELKLEKI